MVVGDLEDGVANDETNYRINVNDNFNHNNVYIKNSINNNDKNYSTVDGKKFINNNSNN